ncbi:hypothetical protein HanPSC8_Chr08g0328781 [Helianthus annuus]|nr:hypothetical protein HanPSC8_Chr08g0328781 [Helianthus annuus]
MMQLGVMVELLEEYQMVMDLLRDRMRNILNSTRTRTRVDSSSSWSSTFYNPSDQTSSSYIVFF